MSIHTPDDEPLDSPLPIDDPTASAGVLGEAAVERVVEESADADVRSVLDQALADDQAYAERLTGILPVDDENDDAHTFDPGPISGYQHDLEEVGPHTDDATSFHPTTDANDPAAPGADQQHLRRFHDKEHP